MIVIGLAVLGLFHQRIYNSFAGPFAMEASKLATLEEVPFGKLVRLERNGKPVTHAELEDTGASEVEYSRRGSSTVASFGVFEIDGRQILVRVEQRGNDNIEGVIREIDSSERQLAGSDAKLMLDCTMRRYRMWSLGLAALGVLTILLGFDQLRRATRKPKPTSFKIFDS